MARPSMEAGNWLRRRFIESAAATIALGLLPNSLFLTGAESSNIILSGNCCQIAEPDYDSIYPLKSPPKLRESGIYVPEKSEFKALSEQKEISFNSSVLYYHEINRAKITSDIMSLLNQGYVPISINDFVRDLKGNRDIDPKSFMVTFDDSRLSQFTEGLPAIDAIQRQMNVTIPVTFFAIVGFINEEFDSGQYALSELPDNLPAYYDGPYNKYMTKAQLIQVLQWGHTIQNHTINHPNLTRISDEDARNELNWGEGRVNELYRLAGLMRFAKTMAFPYGSNDARIRDLVASLNFDAAFATTAHSAQGFIASDVRQNSTTDRLRLPRLRQS